MFKIHKEEIEINGKKITLETGKIARQADGAIIATCGETMVIATAVGAKNLKDIFYFYIQLYLLLLGLEREARILPKLLRKLL